jgi:hypothetical protein
VSENRQVRESGQQGALYGPGCFVDLRYRIDSAVLDPKHVKRLNAGGGMLGTSIVVDGRVIGTWRRTLARATVVIELDLFEAPVPRARQAIAAAQRYGAFLGLQISVAIAGGHR